MKILYATSEAVPFCKTGGLADVAGSLPPALAASGAEVAVVLPLYQKVKEKFSDQLHFECYDYVDLAWRHSYCGLFSMERDGVTWYFLDNEQYFRRPELYGYMDDGERFGFFSRAVVRMLPHLRFWPEVIHCNDWQTALVPIYLKDDSVREELAEWSGRCGYSEQDIQVALARFGLEGHEAQHPYDLSGGQRQKLALAKLLLTDPQLLFLDEPTKGLDPASCADEARLVRALADEGRTVVLVTHDLDFALAVADEVSMVFDGELACTEPVDRFFDNNLVYRPNKASRLFGALL